MSITTLRVRWVGAALVVTIVSALPLRSVNARYMTPDLVNIPIQRLTRNLELLVEKNPRDAAAMFNLARAHAMAFALRSNTLEVRRNKEGEGAWFGYDPPHVPFVVKQADDLESLRQSRQHLAKAIEWYKRSIAAAPDNLPAELGFAWCLEQSGKKVKAIKKYRRVIRAAWEKEKDLKHADLGWHSITAEAAEYLIPLLDQAADKEEITTLQGQIKQMGMVSRPVTPVVIPLRAGLSAVELEDRSARVNFDADGTGLKKPWTWITRDAGWLVYDRYSTGSITSALQMFGGVTFWMFWENGYQALAMLDDDRDGMLAGEELRGLAIWRDLNVNGVSERGEVKPLADWNIVALSCRYLRNTSRPDRMPYSPQGVFFRDGSSRPTYDVILHPAIAAVD
ncbi:MAG TPA: hypothetical protein VLU47_07990 [Blastocatellia bacterium]|nr:hypothetical protein [Blastocatellia bacterium]